MYPTLVTRAFLQVPILKVEIDPVEVESFLNLKAYTKSVAPTDDAEYGAEKVRLPIGDPAFGSSPAKIPLAATVPSRKTCCVPDAVIVEVGRTLVGYVKFTVIGEVKAAFEEVKNSATRSTITTEKMRLKNTKRLFMESTTNGAS